MQNINKLSKQPVARVMVNDLANTIHVKVGDQWWSRFTEGVLSQANQPNDLFFSII
jgi:hypothetical protein